MFNVEVLITTPVRNYVVFSFPTPVSQSQAENREIDLGTHIKRGQAMSFYNGDGHEIVFGETIIKESVIEFSVIEIEVTSKEA